MVTLEIVVGEVAIALIGAFFNVFTVSNNFITYVSQLMIVLPTASYFVSKWTASSSGLSEQTMTPREAKPPSP